MQPTKLALDGSTGTAAAVGVETPSPPAADPAQVLHRIAAEVLARRAAAPDRVTVVGIDGPTAAGKSTLAAALAATLSEAGVKSWVFQLDWTLKERSEREADVAHLQQAGAAFEYEGELHMRLERGREALEAIARFNRQLLRGDPADREVELTRLYSRAAGGTETGRDVMPLATGMVVIVDGHYTLRTELDALIDLNIVLLSDLRELLTRKINRVRGYRSPDDAVHYFWHTDLPSFAHHLARFGRNADLIVDNTDYRHPRIVGRAAEAEWRRATAAQAIARPRRLERLSDIPEYVLSESRLVPPGLGEILTASVQAVVDWDRMVGECLRVAVDEVDQDLETRAQSAAQALSRDFAAYGLRARLSHTDALYRVYHRKLPLTLGLEIDDSASGRTVMCVLAEVESDHLRVGVFWAGGGRWLRFDRTLGSIGTTGFALRDGATPREPTGAAARTKMFLPTQFTVPAFLDGLDLDPVFIGREQENIPASAVLSSVLQAGGVWIHRFALHREIRFFQYCLAVEGVPSAHVGNYLIAVSTADPALRRRFREFQAEWTTPIDRVAVTRHGQDAYDEAIDAEKAAVREYVSAHAPRFAIKDGALFGNVYDRHAIDAVLREVGALLRSPYRILRRRTIDLLEQQCPGLTLRTAELWSDVPGGARRTLSLSEFTALSSSIMAEVYLWLALRNERAAVLGANVYDVRRSSLDGRAFLEAAADRGCPIVLQCSMNAVGQREVDGDGVVHGYLKPVNGVEDFSQAVRRAARDLYLLTGKRPPLFGIGLDHITVAWDRPAGRSRRFLQHALASGGVTHLVLDGSDLFRFDGGGRDELAGTFRRMSDWVIDLMDSPGATFLKDMEICISELNYVGGSEAYLPSTDDIRLFAQTYTDALAARGFGAHIARPKLFISNLGTRHHSADDVRPWVELSREWRDAVKGEGFVSAVLHGTSRSHQDTLSAATVGCHKVNVAGDFLDTLVENLPMELSRTVQDGPGSAKTRLAAIRSDLDALPAADEQKLYEALREHCGRVLKTVASPPLSSMDANYFQYKDYDFSDMQVRGILAAIERQLRHLLHRAPRRLSDSREGCAFAASMIEVPEGQFKGPVLDALWAEGVRHFHVDAGDGQFIPRRFSGVDRVRHLRAHFPSAVIHAHLMVVNPHYPKDGEFAEIQQYAEAGANGVAFHVRSCHSRREAVSALTIIRKLGMRPGIVIETSDAVDEDLEQLITEQALDWVIVMGVPIGYGGQVFQYSTLNRVSRLHDMARRLGRDFLVECDGGLNMQNIELCRNAGAQLFSGWSIVKAPSVDDIKRKVRAVRGVLARTA